MKYFGILLFSVLKQSVGMYEMKKKEKKKKPDSIQAYQKFQSAWLRTVSIQTKEIKIKKENISCPGSLVPFQVKPQASRFC